jgi:hypothetical protein
MIGVRTQKGPFKKPRTPQVYQQASNAITVIEEPVYGIAIAGDSEQDNVIITSPSLNNAAYIGMQMRSCATPFFSSLPTQSVVVGLKNPWYGYLEPPITVRQFYQGTVGKTYYSSVLAYFDPISHALPMHRAPIIVQSAATANGVEIRCPVFGRDRINILAKANGNAAPNTYTLKPYILGGNGLTELLTPTDSVWAGLSGAMDAGEVCVNELYSLTVQAVRDQLNMCDVIGVTMTNNDGTMDFQIAAFDTVPR